MESVEVREALTTAILLGEAAKTSHIVEIDCIGKVQIDNGYAAFTTQAGEWKRITRQNLSQRLSELMEESLNTKVKRRIKTLMFS